MRKINFLLAIMWTKKESARSNKQGSVAMTQQFWSGNAAGISASQSRVAAMPGMKFLDFPQRAPHALGLAAENSIDGGLRGTEFSGNLQLRPLGGFLNFFDEERDIFVHGRNYTRMDRQCNTRMDRSLYSAIRARIVAR